VGLAGVLEDSELEAALHRACRLHWGKLHTAGDACLAAVHPGWAAFRAIAGPGAEIP
jgi:hypothetical protein